MLCAATNVVSVSCNDQCLISTAIFKTELQEAISACRRTRLLVDKYCSLLLNQAVTIMPVCCFIKMLLDTSMITIINLFMKSTK